MLQENHIMTNSQIITKYAKVNMGKLSQITILYHCNYVTELVSHLSKPIEEITTEDISSWIDNLMLNGFSQKAVCNKLGGLRQFLIWCSGQHILSDDSFNDEQFFKSTYKRIKEKRGIL